MLQKVLSMSLAVMILATASSVSVFANANGGGEKTTAAAEKPVEKIDLKTAVKLKKDSVDLDNASKSTLADYRRAQKQGSKFSTTTKILIGVGIAAAVVGIVVFAASRDKIRTF
jgi:hypothetical protein